MRTVAPPLLVLALGALAAACATKFAEPEKTQPAAELRLVPGTSGIAASSWVNGYSTEGCEEKEGEGRLATFNLVNRLEKTLRIAPGSRFYVLAGAHVQAPVGAEVRKQTCSAMASFVPEANRAYEVTQDFATRNCPITIKDLTTGTEAASAQKHRVTGACREVK